MTTTAGSSPAPRKPLALPIDVCRGTSFVTGALLIVGPLVLIPGAILDRFVRPRCFFLKNSLLSDLLIGSG